jgi:hypothetical protein
VIPLWLWLGTAAILFAAVFIFGVFTVASVNDVNNALAIQTQAIRDLEARLPPPPPATAADLDNILTQVNTNTNSINAITFPGHGTRSTQK